MSRAKSNKEIRIPRLVSTALLREHPLASLIPEMRPSEWQDFYRDIAFRGILTPLEILGDGTVLDGRHRLRAAKQLGIPEIPVLDAPLNGESPEIYMLKAAVLRRHLSDDQRGMMAAMLKQENKKEPEQGDRDLKGRFSPSAERPAEGDSKSGFTRQEVTREFNVSRWKVDQSSYVLNRNPELAQKVHRGDIALRNAYRQVKAPEERQRIEATKPPTGIYQVLIVDPPWPYTDRQNDPSHDISNPYQPMSIEQIKDLKIPAAPDSILWLWTTNTFMHEAYHVLEAWGFNYHTTLTWAKDYVGLGDWLGGQTEHCLLATKGTYHIFRKNESTLLTSPRGKHSQKPDSFYEMVERLCPGTKIDMFARRNRDGWECWGAEVDKRMG